MLDPGPASWWAALESNGLDNLSAPELAHAVQELAYDRPAFLGVLAAASDYPRFSLCSQRRPDRDKMAALDRHLPRCRAVLVPEDDSAIRAALAAFDVLLVLDPLWHAPDLLYASWHARGRRWPALVPRAERPGAARRQPGPAARADGPPNCVGQARYCLSTPASVGLPGASVSIGHVPAGG